MASKVPDLDTPFRAGEKVTTMRGLPRVPEGTPGRVKLVNGLHTWIRYWVKFDNGEMVGQVSHDDLVRPDMIDAWRERSTRAANVVTETAGVPAGVDSGAVDTGAAGLIPAVILERSKAAKARLLG